MCKVTDWQTAVLAIWAVIEYWLGKTQAVQAGSTIEIAINSVKKIINMVRSSETEKQQLEQNNKENK